MLGRTYNIRFPVSIMRPTQRFEIFIHFSFHSDIRGSEQQGSHYKHFAISIACQEGGAIKRELYERITVIHSLIATSQRHFKCSATRVLESKRKIQIHIPVEASGECIDQTDSSSPYACSSFILDQTFGPVFIFCMGRGRRRSMGQQQPTFLSRLCA